MEREHVIYRLEASGPRRVFGTAMLGGLGLLLLWLAATTGSAFGWRLVLLAMAVGALCCALALWKATAVAILLTQRGLVQSDGRILALMEEIEAVDRGMFAMKPSNGFLVRLRKSAPFGWAPGLWWRWGGRLGVGGVTGSGAAKALADALAMRLNSGR